MPKMKEVKAGLNASAGQDKIPPPDYHPDTDATLMAPEPPVSVDDQISRAFQALALSARLTREMRNGPVSAPAPMGGAGPYNAFNLMI